MLLCNLLLLTTLLAKLHSETIATSMMLVTGRHAFVLRGHRKHGRAGRGKRTDIICITSGKPTVYRQVCGGSDGGLTT